MTDQKLKLLTALQPKIREAMGDWLHGDKYINTRVGFSGYFHSGETLNVDFLRIPHAIPLPGEDVKRTLVGMIAGHIHLYRRKNDWVIYRGLRKDGYVTKIIGDTPYLALLKCLAVQEGVEEK